MFAGPLLEFVFRLALDVYRDYDYFLIVINDLFCSHFVLEVLCCESFVYWVYTIFITHTRARARAHTLSVFFEASPTF